MGIKLRKTAYMLLAGALLASGCASTSYQTRQKVEISSTPKITFSEKRPTNLDELVEAKKSFDKTLAYSERMGGIKEKIEGDPKYDPKEDLRSLVTDVESSGLENSKSIAASLRDFSYYKDYENVEYRTRKPKQVGGLGAYTIGAYTFLIYLLVRYGTMDEKQGNLGKATGEALGVGAGVGLTLYLWDYSGSKSQKVHRKRVVVQPFYGLERNVE